MNEYRDACARLAADLIEAGIGRAQTVCVVGAYARALERPSNASWAAVYLGVHAALAALARVAPTARGAYERLVMLADDDLGAALIPASERERVRARLVEAA